MAGREGAGRGGWEGLREEGGGQGDREAGRKQRITKSNARSVIPCYSYGDPVPSSTLTDTSVSAFLLLTPPPTAPNTLSPGQTVLPTQANSSQVHNFDGVGSTVWPGLYGVACVIDEATPPDICAPFDEQSLEILKGKEGRRNVENVLACKKDTGLH